MTHGPGHHERLERYLDGLLEGAELAAFERELAASPQLSALVDTQRRLDEALRRSFEPSAAETPAPAAWWRGRRVLWLGLAAAVVLGAVGVWAVVMFGDLNGLGTLYHRTVAAGFQPEEICTDDAQFAEWVDSKYGQVLRPKADRGDIQLVGWSYAKVVTAYSGVLLARAGGHEVLVIMDRADREEGRPWGHAGPGLRVFRRQMGKLVLYEVTPLDSPRVTELLEAPAG